MHTVRPPTMPRDIMRDALSNGEVAQAARLDPSIQVSVVHEVPVTMRHPPPAHLDKYIANPGCPVPTRPFPRRGLTAALNRLPTPQCYNNTYSGSTDKGFRKLGFNYLISFMAGIGVHVAFSLPTAKSWIPNPLLPIYIDRINRTKHGSDSEVYDTEGRFVPQKFEEIFSKYDRENKGGLTWRDIQEMVYSNMNVNDPNGWISERLEWYATYLLCKNEHGIITKEMIRGMYDGSIWERIANEVEVKRKAPRGTVVDSYQAQKKAY